MPRPMDDLVYATPDGEDYVALFEDRWYSWPAEHNGWEQRLPVSASFVEDCDELPPRLARLALQLSGVLHD